MTKIGTGKTPDIEKRLKGRKNNTLKNIAYLCKIHTKLKIYCTMKNEDVRFIYLPKVVVVLLLTELNGLMDVS